jgi:hypothetical protein
MGKHRATFDEPFHIDHYAEPSYGIQVPVPGGFTLKVHRKENCKGRHCVIHNPSDHPLKDAPLNWRGDRALMERICEHGVGHPDPDDIAYKVMLDPINGPYESIHGCCAERCCHAKVDA